MTLQERMIAVYLRQAKLPPEEKDKLKLFLGLLLETLEEEEPWERKLREDASAEQSRAEQSRAYRRRRRPLPLAWIQKRPMGLQARRPRLSMA